MALCIYWGLNKHWMLVLEMYELFDVITIPPLGPSLMHAITQSQ
jgi:hypothetical protein